MQDTYILEFSPDIRDFPLYTVSSATLMEQMEHTAADISVTEFDNPIWPVILNLFRQNSFIIENVPCDEDDEEETNQANGYIVKANHIARKNYFYKRYIRFKDEAGRMTLQDMLSQTATSHLTQLLEDNEGPFVYLHGTGLITLDRFIREMADDVPYYMGNIFELSE